MKIPKSNTVQNPSLFGRAINRQYYNIRNGYDYNHKGIDIIDEEWDTLVILDACRYDLFAEHVEWEGQLQRRISRGSATNEWLTANLHSRELHKVVYTTANPMYLSNKHNFDLRLHDVIDIVGKSKWGVGTPTEVTETALEVHRKYPKKRHIVHYVQPHYPFISEDAPISAEKQSEGNNIWSELINRNTDIKESQIIKSYQKNIEPVLNSVRHLLDSLTGRIVVSSDHGNMLGERSRPVPTTEWGHPPGIYTPELVQVPWFVDDGEGRRSIVEEDPAEIKDATSGVKKRLERLGYV
jgi:CRISPR/Cas system-associated exonuclease Cas4 (RecB family)